MEVWKRKEARYRYADVGFRVSTRETGVCAVFQREAPVSVCVTYLFINRVSYSTVGYGVFMKLNN